MEDSVSTADPGGFDGAAGDTFDASDDTAPAAPSETPVDDGATSEAEGAYWRENIRLLLSLMAIWFACSYGAGILFRGFLDQFMLGGYPLGFWFAQQGSIYIFIALIFFYVVRMKQIERKYDLHD